MDERIHTDDAFELGGRLPAQSNRDSLHGLVQALASVVIGLTFIVAGPAAMLLIWTLWDSRFRGFSRLDMVLIAICGFIGCLMILASAVFGFVFGITAILTARRHHQPASLAIAGVLLTGFTFLLWIFITVLWGFAIGSRM